jgi:uncharacterized protein (TIGR00369 family)
MADNNPASSSHDGRSDASRSDDTNGFGINVPFAKLLGIRVVEQDREHALLRVHNRAELLNSWGVANGGVVMTLLDLAMGCACRGYLGQALSMITVDISMGFMNPAHAEILATGRVLRGGKSLLFCEAEARDPDGTLLAKGLGTLKAIYPKT